MSVRVKICGLTRVEDVQYAVNAGADALGFVFYAPSPRAVTAVQVMELIKYIPPYVVIVGLFVDANLSEIQKVIEQIPIDVLQFHGNESAETCQNIAKSVGRRWYKAIQMREDLDVLAEMNKYREAGASAILLDAYHPSLKGGTGETFDWHKFPKSDIPLILAGGLNPDNIEEAIKNTTPYAVDVSGGVEKEKGIKDAEKVRRFIQNAKQ